MRGLTNRCGGRERQRMASLTYRLKPQTARANIVSCPDRRAGHVVDTTRRPRAGVATAKKTSGAEIGAE